MGYRYLGDCHYMSVLTLPNGCSCQYLFRNNNLGYEGAVSDFNMATTLQEMIREHSLAILPHKIESRHWDLITLSLRNMFLLFDCFHRFEGILKKGKIYEAIGASQFNPIDERLLKIFVARWCPNINTAVTCYRELVYPCGTYIVL